MDIAVFSLADLPIALGALRAIDPMPSAHQDRFLESLARVHGARVDARTLPVPAVEETAARILDPHQRERLVQLAVVMTTVDGVVIGEPARNVARLAKALDVSERALHTLRELAAQHHSMARFDMIRRTAGRLIGEVWEDEKLAGIRKFIGAFTGGWVDAATAWKYKQLGLLPEGTFGRAYWEHCTKRRFAFPGEAGGIPEKGVFHDYGHVLAGYDTDPDGEIQQAAFQAGFVRKDGFAFLFFGILQFHLGLQLTPIAGPETGYFDVEKVMTALARGAACKVDLSDHWDPAPYFARPLDEVRAEMGIPPLPR